MSMRRELQAADIMQTNVLCLNPEMTLLEAKDILLRHRISGAPVIEGGQLVGVLSLSDIVRVGLSKEADDFPENSYFLGLPPIYGAELGTANEHLEDRLVEEAMATQVYTASPDDRISVLAVSMRQHRIHRLVVVDSGKVVGIITTFDLLQMLENH